MNDVIGLYSFYFISNITINYNNVEKEDLYVGFTRVLDENVELGIPIGYETNITLIPNLISKLEVYISFKKSTGHPLIFFINYFFSMDFPGISLKEEIIYDNLH